MAEAGLTATVHYTGTLDDGTVFDSSRNMEPLKFKIGAGRVIRGFDEAVQSMELGQTKTVRIPPEEAYGPYDEEKVEPMPMYSIPDVQNITIGKTFYFRTQDQLMVPAKILRVEEGTGYVDFNHPLAGQALNFEIELISVN